MMAVEMDFDLAMRRNLGGSRHLLVGLRSQEVLLRTVYANTVSVFGGAAMPRCVGIVLNRRLKRPIASQRRY